VGNKNCKMQDNTVNLIIAVQLLQIGKVYFAVLTDRI
jgi:hypothetical protein